MQKQKVMIFNEVNIKRNNLNFSINEYINSNPKYLVSNITTTIGPGESDRFNIIITVEMTLQGDEDDPDAGKGFGKPNGNNWGTKL